MNGKKYIKEHLAFLPINLCIFGLLSLFLLFLEVPIMAILLIFFIWFAPISSFMIMQYMREKQYLNELLDTCEKLDQKYLLPEIIKEPEYLEGRIYHSVLQQANKSMLERVTEYQNFQREYQEYIETWVHEIKTPIACIGLLVKNHSGMASRKIQLELQKLDNDVERVLYYAKSNYVNEDYIIVKFSLYDMVTDAVRRNAAALREFDFSVDVSGVKGDVYSDPKWIGFIMNQILSNTVQYRSQGQHNITMYSQKARHCTILFISDNGIGIEKKDQEKLFEKGFTGENGRKYRKSTGIGLYLCKKLCDRLGIGIVIQSELARGTTVQLIFPENEHTAIM